MTTSFRTLAQQAMRRIPVVGKIVRQRDELRATVNQLWQPPGHFYSPIPSRDEVRRREASIFATRELSAIDMNEAGQLALLDRLSTVAGDHAFTTQAGQGTRYHFDNPAFGTVDALVWAGILRLLRPARVIEAGSGYSTCVLMDTADRSLSDARPDVTLIEPYPELVQRLLRPDDRVRLLATSLQDVPLSQFAALEAGDVLFIDSTHVSKTGSDVNYVVFEIMPRLAAGVYVHIHDVFDGFEYPREWVEQGRAWNEAYLVRAFLQYNAAFEIALWVPWLARVHADRLRRAICAPPPVGEIAGSLWLRKR